MSAGGSGSTVPSLRSSSGTRTGSAAAGPREVEELVPHLRALGVLPAPHDGARLRVQLAHPAHLCAEVMRLDRDGDAVGADERLERVGDLVTHALLDREALAEHAHEARELGD